MKLKKNIKSHNVLKKHVEWLEQPWLVVRKSKRCNINLIENFKERTSMGRNDNIENSL